MRVRPTLLSDPPASNGGGASFQSVHIHDLPLALAGLHWSTRPGDAVTVDLPPLGEIRLDDLAAGAGFTVDGTAGRLTSLRRERTLPDTVGPDMAVLVCGLNPSLVAADAGYGYAGASNRFWKAAVTAGLVTRPGDPLRALEADGVGMTDLVKRATPSAAALTAEEYRAGAARVARLVAWLGPRAVAFVGLTGWRAAIDRHARAGWQPQAFAGVPAYVLPSTSGLNAHATLAELVDHLRAARASRPPPLAGPEQTTEFA